MGVRQAAVAGTVLAATSLVLAVASPADGSATSIEPSGCPHPPEGWSQKALLPIVEGPGFQGVVLPAKAGRAVLCQCSRESPGPASGYWTPSLSDILPMEARLPDYLRAHPHLGRPGQWRQLNGYLRQYLGFERAGRRFIYVNAVGEPLFSPRGRRRRAIERAWRSTAFVACDGGPDFFGAEYDVATGKFTRIDFNVS